MGLADGVPGRLGRGEGGAGLGQQHAPGVGQRDAVPVTVEQDRVEFVLQGPDRAGDPGRHHVQPPDARVNESSSATATKYSR